MTERAVTVRDRAEQIVKSLGRIGRRFIRWWTLLRIAGAAALALASLIGTLGYLNERELLCLTETAKQILEYLSANVSTELASIAITILFVDCLYQRREREREKGRLILQMGSPDNAFAREAVRALRLHRWLYDGSLKGAALMDANLYEAPLMRANLQEATLRNANLRKADLGGTNLQRANLIDAKLQKAKLWSANLRGADLWGANLQEASLMSANFEGSVLLHAKLHGAEYNNATTWPAGFTPPPEAINVDATP